MSTVLVAGAVRASGARRPAQSAPRPGKTGIKLGDKVSVKTGAKARAKPSGKPVAVLVARRPSAVLAKRLRRPRP